MHNETHQQKLYTLMTTNLFWKSYSAANLCFFKSLFPEVLAIDKIQFARKNWDGVDFAKNDSRVWDLLQRPHSWASKGFHLEHLIFGRWKAIQSF